MVTGYLTDPTALSHDYNLFPLPSFLHSAPVPLSSDLLFSQILEKTPVPPFLPTFRESQQDVKRSRVARMSISGRLVTHNMRYKSSGDGHTYTIDFRSVSISDNRRFHSHSAGPLEERLHN